MAGVTRVFYLLIISIGLFLLVQPALATASSSVHGQVYDWATFDTINNTVVEVYSMPGQTLVERAVVKSGSYTFDLPGGTYLLSAKTGTPGTLSELLVTENITITDNGDYTIDLVLFPPTGLEDLEALNESELISTPAEQVTQTPVPSQPGISNDLVYMGIGVIIVVVVGLIAAAVYIYRPGMKKKTTIDSMPETTRPHTAEEESIQRSGENIDINVQQIENPARPAQFDPVQDQTLPPDCRDVVTIMEKNGGRITQLELRKLLPYSEAKVSLIVSDLENRGIVKKIKKGRGNILIMNRPDKQPPEK